MWYSARIMQLMRVVFSIFLIFLSVSARADVEGTLDYDAAINKYRFFNGNNWVSIGIPMLLSPCSNEAVIDFSNSLVSFVYCNGTNWVTTNFGLTINICSDAGKWNYNYGAKRYEFCNGLFWVRMV